MHQMKQHESVKKEGGCDVRAIVWWPWEMQKGKVEQKREEEDSWCGEVELRRAPDFGCLGMLEADLPETSKGPCMIACICSLESAYDNGPPHMLFRASPPRSRIAPPISKTDDLNYSTSDFRS